MKRKIALLGATGSIGTQALDIIRSNPDLFEVVLLTGHRQVELLTALAREFMPREVVIADPALYLDLRNNLAALPIAVSAGEQALEEAVTHPDIDLVLSSLVGYAGVLPTLAAIRARKTIALANKETLVVAGALIMEEAERAGVTIYPVDSEHSAIYQCLMGEKAAPERLILTASGGPFLRHSLEQLDEVTPQQALKHPKWEMGAKVTIDSATLMNKGFEMIEAHWLFGIAPERIEVLVHPQSIVHSMVQFTDGSVKAQLGQPDMRLPIGLALGLGERIANDYPRCDFTLTPLTFEQPDHARFPNLSYAYHALAMGGTAPCVLNAANEVAVAAFLKAQVSFRGISRLIETMLNRPDLSDKACDLSTLIEINREVVRQTEDLVRTGRY